MEDVVARMVVAVSEINSNACILATTSSTHLRVPILSSVAISRSSPSYLSDGSLKQFSNRTSIKPTKISSFVYDDDDCDDDDDGDNGDGDDDDDA